MPFLLWTDSVQSFQTVLYVSVCELRAGPGANAMGWSVLGRLVFILCGAFNRHSTSLKNKIWSCFSSKQMIKTNKLWWTLKERTSSMHLRSFGVFETALVASPEQCTRVVSFEWSNAAASILYDSTTIATVSTRLFGSDGNDVHLLVPVHRNPVGVFYMFVCWTERNFEHTNGTTMRGSPTPSSLLCTSQRAYSGPQTLHRWPIKDICVSRVAESIMCTFFRGTIESIMTSCFILRYRTSYKNLQSISKANDRCLLPLYSGHLLSYTKGLENRRCALFMEKTASSRAQQQSTWNTASFIAPSRRWTIYTTYPFLILYLQYCVHNLPKFISTIITRFDLNLINRSVGSRSKDFHGHFLQL